MAYYQSYRKVKKDEKKKNGKIDNDKLREKVRHILEPTLPSHIEFEILEFINEVKTKKPIPWIMEFDDVTDVKTKLQKKMLNELAEVFLIKSMRFETVIDALNKILAGLSKEEQDKALKKINLTKEFPEINKKLAELETKLVESNSKLDSTKTTRIKEREKLTKKIENLNEEITDLKRKSITHYPNNFLIEDGKLTLNDIGLTGSTLNLGNVSSGNLVTFGDYFGSNYCDKCEKCGKQQLDYSAQTYLSSNNFRNCPSCKRCLCNTCWPKSNYITFGKNIEDSCNDCQDSAK